jgi:hypothetical protein
MLYTDSNCTKSYGSLWVPEISCLSIFNPLNQKMVCTPGESYVYFNDVTTSDCSGTRTLEYVNPCTAPQASLGGHCIYTRYTCFTLTTTSMRTSSPVPTTSAAGNTAKNMTSSAISSSLALACWSSYVQLSLSAILTLLSMVIFDFRAIDK